ncbi:MAG: NAD(P)H-dependent glycerol-3-phosphate dehydrogenase [Fibrobacterota bacterium]
MKIGILGAGSWAIALAKLLHENNHRVCLWEYDTDEAALLKKRREHPVKLPGIFLSEDIEITSSMDDFFAWEPAIVIIAVPAQFVRSVVKSIETTIDVSVHGAVLGWVIVAKGIENKTNSLLTDVMEEVLSSCTKDNCAVLSGPSHAEEVSRGVPTTVVASSKNYEFAQLIQEQFSTDFFRIYTNDDVTGVELAGSVKNVIALAAGICDGLQFGDNTKGALLTRGMVEMARLGEAMGAKEHTFSGLAGFGDLITTCFSKHSRNRRMGEILASGKSLKEALKEMPMVAEGVTTVTSLFELAGTYGIDMPITEKIHDVLYTDESPREAVVDLMRRSYKPERY